MKLKAAVAFAFVLGLPVVARAECIQPDLFAKLGEVTRLLSPPELPVETEESARMKDEGMTLYGSTPSDEVCAKLDALIARAKALKP